jgi:elongation factor P
MVNATELRPGNHFEFEKNIYTVIDVSLNKTAMRKMVVKAKVKNLRTGAITEMSFLGGTDVEKITLDKKKMTYLYEANDNLVFMDKVSFEQLEISRSKLAWEVNFLMTEQEIEILMYEAEILGVSLPAKVALKVTECEPAVKGDTINKAMKEATLETGYKLKVPLFISEGETISVRTEDGSYDGRA